MKHTAAVFGMNGRQRDDILRETAEGTDGKQH